MKTRLKHWDNEKKLKVCSFELLSICPPNTYVFTLAEQIQDDDEVLLVVVSFLRLQQFGLRTLAICYHGLPLRHGLLPGLQGRV